MGEYLTTSQGNDVKLGTCEHLMYIRKDEVEAEAAHNQEAAKYLNPECNWIYRFPWPQEDGQDLNQVAFCEPLREPFDYGNFVFTCDVEIDHQEIRHHISAMHSYGVNVMAPCPAGVNKKSSFQPIKIIGERVRPGQYYTVFACGYCDQWFSLDAEEGGALEKIKLAIMECEQPHGKADPDSWHKKVCARLKARQA